MRLIVAFLSPHVKYHAAVMIGVRSAPKILQINAQLIQELTTDLSKIGTCCWLMGSHVSHLGFRELNKD